MQRKDHPVTTLNEFVAEVILHLLADDTAFGMEESAPGRSLLDREQIEFFSELAMVTFLCLFAA